MVLKNLNIYKPMLAIAASAVLVTTSLVGCVEGPQQFTYGTSSTGEVEVSGYIDYDLLKQYEVVELTIYDKTEVYIAEKIRLTNRFAGFSEYYVNILNGHRIFDKEDNNENKSIKSLGGIEDCLLYYNMIKQSYTKEDVEELLSKIKEDYNNHHSKTLVKEGNSN